MIQRRLLFTLSAVVGLLGGAGLLVVGEEPRPLVAVLTPHDQIPYEPSQKQPLPNAELELRIRERIPDEPTIATIEFQIWSSNFDTHVFNPYKTHLIPASYNIAVFDKNHQHVGSVYSVFLAGSRRYVAPGDWESIVEDCGVCKRIPLRSARVYRPWVGDKIVLPPGQYELQVIANSLLFMRPPANAKGHYDEEAALVWPKERINADAWRSNRVPLEIRESDAHDEPPPPKRSRPPSEE